MKEAAICPKCHVLHGVDYLEAQEFRKTGEPKWIECESCTLVDSPTKG